MSWVYYRSCRSLAQGIRQRWPLEFNLRPHESGRPAPAAETASDRQAEERDAGRARWRERMHQTPIYAASHQARQINCGAAFSEPGAESGRSKGDWNAILVRGLWTSLEPCQASRAISGDHEEAWLILAGFFLRPGFGVAMDESRIDALWRICSAGLSFPGKRTELQEYILWRRVAGGLSREWQETALGAEIDKIREGKVCPPELIVWRDL